MRRLSALLILAFLVLPAAALAGPVTPGPAEARLLQPPVAPRPEHSWSPAEYAAHPPPQGPALPSIQDGIGPGSALQQYTEAGGGSGYICTAGFLLRDPATAKYYLSTAGHCLVQDETDTTAYTGAADPDKVMPEVQVCMSGCIDNALGMGQYVTLDPGPNYHPVLFAQSGGIGTDFGVIALPASVHDQLRPWMPQWGGPTSYDAGSSGDLMAHYGHGSYCCPVTGAVASRTPADQGRMATSLGNDGDSFTGIGHITGGDSGSAIVLADPDTGRGVQGTAAVGVLTHSVGIEVSAPVFYGTTLEKGLAMVKGKTGMALELVLQDDPLTALPKVTYNLTIQSPAEGTRFAAGNVTVRGSASGSMGLPEGTQVEVAVDDASFVHKVVAKGTAPWQATVHVDGKSGAHTLFARLVGADGAALATATVGVKLDPKAPPPPAAPKGTASPGDVQPAGDEGAAAGEPATDAPESGRAAPPRQAPATALLPLTLVALAWALRRRE